MSNSFFLGFWSQHLVTALLLSCHNGYLSKQPLISNCWSSKSFKRCKAKFVPKVKPSANQDEKEVKGSEEDGECEGDQGPVSRKSRNFSGDIILFVSSIGTRFVLWNFSVILSFLLSETYYKSRFSRQADHSFKTYFPGPISYRVFRETAPRTPAHGNILNLSKLRVSLLRVRIQLRKRFIGRVFETVSCQQFLCFLESFVAFRVYRFT